MTKHQAMRNQLENLIKANEQEIIKLYRDRDVDQMTAVHAAGMINALSEQNIALQAILDAWKEQ